MEADDDEVSKLSSIMNNLQVAKAEVETFKLWFSARCDDDMKDLESSKLTSVFNCINAAITHLSYFIAKSKCAVESYSIKNEVTKTIPDGMLKVEMKDDYEDNEDINDHFVIERNYSYDIDISSTNVKREEECSPVRNVKVDEDTSEDPLIITNIKSEPPTSASQKNLSPEVKHDQSQDNVYKCICCSKVFQRYMTFKKHIETDNCGNINARLECPLCQKNFTDSTVLKRHIQVLHEGIREIVDCKVCGKQMNKGSLREHMFIHTEATHQCPSCPRKFASKALVTRHHKYIHEDFKPFKCEICGKGFPKKFYLDTHSVVHTGEKPYTCDLCGNSYSQKSHLKTHIKKVHEGVKMKKYESRKFMCVECGKLFQRRALLEKHISNFHNGIKFDENKQLACGKCDKLFSSHEGLLKHERIHNANTLDERRTIRCPSCPTTFTLKVNLFRHIKNVHGGIKPASEKKKIEAEGDMAMDTVKEDTDVMNEVNVFTNE